MSLENERTPMANNNGDDDGSVDLKPYIQTLRAHRKTAFRFLLAAAALFIALSLFFLLLSPKERVTESRVRFLFEGAEEGKYPNGDLFSPLEPISTVVLQEVYVTNDLKRFLPYEEFKKGFTVLQRNLEREQLEADYKARLGDPKMTSVERDRLIREYRERVAALRSAEYSLIYSQEYALSTIPSETLRKVMVDVLSVWARNADLRKGALSYRISVFSPKMVAAQLAVKGGDPVIALDILRNHVQKVVRNIDQIMDLPGAAFVEDDKEGEKLIDIRNRLVEMERFQINPLIGRVRSQGITRDHAGTISYLENQLFQLNLQRRAAQERVKLLESSLKSYLQERGSVSQGRGSASGNLSAVIPQVNADFFDKVMEIGQKTSDLEYRKSITERIIRAGEELVFLEKDARYYEEFLRLFQRRGLSRAGEAQIASCEAKYREIASQLFRSIQEINTIYGVIAKQNLNPDSLLYTVVAPPFSTTRYALSKGKVLALCFLYWVLAVLMGMLWVWVKTKQGDAE